MTELHLLRPLWLLALLPAVLFAFALIRRQASRSNWERVVDPVLATVLIENRAEGRRLPWLGVTILIAWTAVSVALAGPVWKRLPQPVFERDSALVLVLDLSLSMYARDLAPSRLVRMKHKVRDLLAGRREGQTGVVAFAGDAHVVTPLTDDTRTIENLLPALEPGIMPVLGSNAASGIELANELLNGAHATRGRILLLTDGVNSTTRIADVIDPRFPVSVIGVGTPAGSAIPLDFADRPGSYLKDPTTGDTVIARLDEGALQRIAQIGQGSYHRITVGDADLASIARNAPVNDRDAEQASERDFDAWQEYGHFAALAVLPLLLGLFRRGIVAAIPIALIAALPPPAEALSWDDLWWRPDQQSWRALQSGDPATAAALAADPEQRGTAQYRGHDYLAAAKSFATGSDADAQYNRGNALALAGSLEKALAAYDAALAIDPNHEDAAFNRAVVEKLLHDQQKSESKDQQAQQDSDTSQDSSGEPQSGDGARDTGDQQEREQAAQSQQADEGQQREQEAKPEASDEQDGEKRQLAESEELERRRALEQWLRRVPDDPGGLLRRKFQHEANLRARQGRRQSAGESIW